MLGSIIVGAVNVVGTLVAAFLMDHAGRRQLLLVSHVIMTVCLAGLAISTWLPCKHPSQLLKFITSRHGSVALLVVIAQLEPYQIDMSMSAATRAPAALQIVNVRKHQPLTACLRPSKRSVRISLPRLQLLAVSAAVEGWISLLAVMGFVLGFSQGSGPIPWVYLGEILPSEIKGPAAALCTSLNWASNLVVGLTFPAMLAGLHLGGAYLVYAVGGPCLSPASLVAESMLVMRYPCSAPHDLDRARAIWVIACAVTAIVKTSRTTAVPTSPCSLIVPMYMYLACAMGSCAIADGTAV